MQTEPTQTKTVSVAPLATVMSVSRQDASVSTSQVRSTSTQYQDIELEVQTQEDGNTAFCVRQEMLPSTRVKHKQSKVILHSQSA